MKSRIRLQNETCFIEWPDTEEGHSMAKHFRRNTAAFKRRHLRFIIQAYPDVIQCAKVYHFDGRELIIA